MRLTRRRGNDGGDSGDPGRDDRSRDDAARDDGARDNKTARRPARSRSTPAAADPIGEPARRRQPAREFGPWDVTEAPPAERGWLDLGALRVPAIAGVEVQLQAGPDGQVQALQLAHEGNQLRLGAFAAPRSEGIWDEIRETVRESLQANGSKPREVEGEYGPELTARVTDGSTTVDIRHIGIDGPRWFVHAVYIGTAATDPTLAGPLQDVLHGLVVDRGTEAMPVQEALPLRLPAEAAAQLAAEQQRGEAQAT